MIIALAEAEIDRAMEWRPHPSKLYVLLGEHEGMKYDFGPKLRMKRWSSKMEELAKRIYERMPGDAPKFNGVLITIYRDATGVGYHQENEPAMHRHSALAIASILAGGRQLKLKSTATDAEAILIQPKDGRLTLLPPSAQGRRNGIRHAVQAGHATNPRVTASFRTFNTQPMAPPKSTHVRILTQPTTQKSTNKRRKIIRTTNRLIPMSQNNAKTGLFHCRYGDTCDTYPCYYYHHKLGKGHNTLEKQALRKTGDNVDKALTLLAESKVAVVDTLPKGSLHADVQFAAQEARNFLAKRQPKRKKD